MTQQSARNRQRSSHYTPRRIESVSLYLGTMMTLTLKLKEYRQRKRLSQAQLAKAVGVRQATISGLETGKSRRIELDVLEKLAKALGIKAGKLIAEK